MNIEKNVIKEEIISEWGLLELLKSKELDVLE